MTPETPEFITLCLLRGKPPGYVSQGKNKTDYDSPYRKLEETLITDVRKCSE